MYISYNPINISRELNVENEIENKKGNCCWRLYNVEEYGY